jgi:hypothetical protein
MDFLHCALIAILVLLAIYCFRSFREGNEATKPAYPVSAVNPAYPNVCYNATVSGQGTHQTIPFFNPSNPIGESYGIKAHTTCEQRGFDTKGVENLKWLTKGDVLAQGNLGGLIERSLPGVKIDVSPQVWTK